MVSLAYSFYFRVPPAVDARAYDNIAWNLVSGNGYQEDASVPIREDNAIMRVGPGYEFFLAGIYYLFGHHYEAVWVIQALLLATSAFLVFLLAKEIFSFGDGSYFIGIIAAILTGFSPDLITMQGMLMSETLGIFLIISTVYLFFRYWNSPDKFGWKIFAAGAFLALAVMVRTPALFLIFPAIWLLAKEKKWKHLLLFFSAVILVFLPWIVRNYNIYRVFIPTNLAYGIDLGSGNHFGATGELEPHPTNDLYLSRYGLVEGSRRLTAEALEFIIFNPLEFLKLTFYRISIYFSFSRPTGFWFHLHGLSRAVTVVLSAVYSALLFILGFWGIQKIRDLEIKEKKRAKIFLAMLDFYAIPILTPN